MLVLSKTNSKVLATGPSNSTEEQIIFTTEQTDSEIW
jgi:hypothetical protein